MKQWNAPLFNPYLTNGFSHYYQLDESAFIFGDIRCDFRFLFTFSINFLLANRIALDWTPRRHIWGYSVCLCPVKRMPGLNELINSRINILLMHNRHSACVKSSSLDVCISLTIKETRKQVNKSVIVCFIIFIIFTF